MATPVNSKSTNSVHKDVPLVVIVGPTASGKSSIAMRVAETYGGEIIAADSRTVYKGMDIGTAKPSVQDRKRGPHWGLDLVEPGEVFTAADFKRYTYEKIAEIRARGHVPILVGGTGLYVDGVVFDYQFGAKNEHVRAKFADASLEELKSYCYSNNIKLPENIMNRRYVLRAIEQHGVNDNRGKYPLPNTIIVGITTSSEELRTRITQRAEQLFEMGMVEEAKILGEKYGWDSEAMTGNIYKLVHHFLDNEFDEAELTRRFVTADWQLAKRQKTWLKRNPFVHWVELDEAYNYIAQQLEKKQLLP